MGLARPTLALFLAACLAGCGSSGSPTSTPGASGPAPTSAATAAPTVGPTPSPDLEPLASQYSTIATSADGVIASCKGDASTASDLAKAKVAAADCLARIKQLVSDNASDAWGPVAPQAGAFFDALVNLEVDLTNMADASDSSTFRQAYDKLVVAERVLRTKADLLRAALGLPPIPSQVIPSASS